jgi:hypothetical protein
MGDLVRSIFEYPVMITSFRLFSNRDKIMETSAWFIMLTSCLVNPMEETVILSAAGGTSSENVPSLPDVVPWLEPCTWMVAFGTGLP